MDADKTLWIDALRQATGLLETVDTEDTPSIEIYPWRERLVELTYGLRYPSEKDDVATVLRMPKDGQASKQYDDNGTVTVKFAVADVPVSVRMYVFGACQLVEDGVEDYVDTEVVEYRTVVKERPKFRRVCPDSLLEAVGG